MAWIDGVANGIQLPDGQVVSFPPGVSEDQAYAQLKSERPELFEKPSGFIPAAQSTITRMAGALSAAPSTVLGGFGDQRALDEAGKIYEQTAREAAEILPEPTQYTDIIEDYKEDGLAEAASTAWTFAREQVGISTPYMVPAMVAGKVGASDLVAGTKAGRGAISALSRFAPALRAAKTGASAPVPLPAKAVLGAAFGIGTLATQFFADNLERQYEVASEGGEQTVTPDDISNFAAAAAAGPQAAMDYIFVALTGGIGRGAQLAASQSLKQSLAATTTQAGKATLGRTIGRGAVESLTEFPTELMQTVLERAQAGESISFEDAEFVNEMKATIAGTIPVVGAFGAAGTYRSHRANKKAEENWNKMSDEERRLRKSQDSQREAAKQAEIERAERIQSQNEARWRAANEQAARNNDAIEQAALQAQENTPVEIEDVIEAADSRNILTNTDGFRAFVSRQTNGRTANLKDTNNQERRRIRSVLSGLKVQEFVEEDGGADMPMFTREQFDTAVRGTRKAKSINTDTVRQALQMGNSKTDRAVASSIAQAMEARGYAQRVKQKGGKKPLKPRRTPYNENQYEELLKVGQENGRITQGDFERVTGKYGAVPYKEFISDMRVRGDLPKADKVKGVFTPVTYQDIQEADDGRTLAVGDYEVTTEPAEGYFVRGPNGEIVDGALSRKDAVQSAKILKHRSRSYTIKKNGQVVKTYKNKNNARDAAALIQEADPAARVEVSSNAPVGFTVDRNKSKGFSTIERVNEEGRRTSVLEYGFSPDENAANVLRDERISEITPGLADWDVRSVEENARARERLSGFLRARGVRLDPAQREEFTTPDERTSFDPERRIEGDQTQRNQTILNELEQALVDAGIDQDVAAKVVNESVNAEGFFDPNLGGLRTLAVNLNHPTVRNAKTEAELRQAVRGIVNHEAIHAMRDLDLFTMNEWNALKNATLRVKRSDGKTFADWAQETYEGIPGYETKESIEEEAVAEMYRQFYSDQNVRRQIAGQPRTLLERIQRFMERLANAFSGIGFGDASQVIQGIGKVQARDRGQVRTLKDTEALSQRNAAAIRRQVEQRQAEAEQPESREGKKPLKRHSITGPRMLEEFERREEVSDQEFQDQYNKELSRRSVAGTNSTLLTVPGDFVPSDMTAKFSIDASNMSDSDLLITNNSSIPEVLEYLNVSVDPRDEIGEIQDVLATINRAIVGVLSGERERLRVLDLNEEDVKKLEGVLKFTRVDYGSDGLHQLEREIATQYGRTDFGGDLIDSYRQFGNSAFGYESEPVRILSSMVDEGYVISGVQNDYDFGISFVDPTSRSASEENLTLPVPLTVALHDLGKLRKEINSGKELSAGTIASLHQRYVSPILNSFKSGTRGAPEGRTILRSLDFSPEGLKSGLKMVSAGASMAAYPFHQSNFENNPTLFEAINNLKTGMPEGDVHKLIDYSLSIPYQRAHAAIFKYIFERTSSDSTTPLYRGTSLSRFLFDISSKEESRSVSDPSYKTALDWAKDKAVGREISIDGLGELSSDANVSDGDFNEGVLLVFPVGSVKQQAPSTAMFTSEAGSFTSGTFTVRNIVTYSNPSEFIEAHIKAFGNQIIEAAEIKRKVLNGELNKSDIIDGFIPSVNKGFSGLSQDLFSEIEEDQNSFIEWSGAVDSQASQVNTEEENYLYSDSDILVKVLNLMMADGALDDFNDSYSYYLANKPEAENAFNVSSNGSIQFNDEAYRRYLYDLEEQGKPVSEKTVEFLNRSVLKDPDFRTSLVRAISYLTSGRASGSPAELLETSHIPIDPDEPFSSIFSGIGYTQRNAASNDLGVPREIRFDSEGTRLGRGAIVTLSQTNNEMRSFGGKFLTDENEVTERAPVIGWTRPPKWSIVNVDEEGFQLVGGQTGSNEGGMYRNEETGEQYYVKTPRDPDIGRNEILASKLYQLAGVEVANADPAVRNGEFSVASTFVPGLETDQMLLTEERVPGVQENFAVDAWLGNWDVIGLVFDNLLIKDGRGIRIDPGGTMPYRAQGGLKNDMRDGLWGPIASDIDSMRDPGIAFEASQVFDKVTDEDLVNGIDKVISIPVDDLRKAVRDFGPVDPDENEEAFNILEARRRDLASRKADIVGDSSAAAQFISTSQPGRRFSLNDLQWEGKGTANQETSSVESFSPDRAMEKVSESTNVKGRERDRRIVRAIKDFKTSPDFDINEITPKEWGPIDDISRPSYGVVVKDDQGNIVLREVANFFDGYHWSIAKGRLDPGESPLETAVRELREETGISEDTVPNFRIVGALPGPYSSGYSDTYLYVAEFDSQPVDQGISKFGSDLLEDTPGFIPRVSKDKATVSADQSIMDETSIPIALGEKQPRKLSATNERLVELNMETARTKGDRSYDVLQAAISPPLVHKSLWESIKDVLSDRPLAWFRQKFVDKYEGIRRAVEKAREIRGDDSYLLAGMDALKAAYLSDKSKGITQEAITSGQLIYKDGITRVDTSKKGLVEILQPLFDGNVDLLRDWHTWMIANREGRFEREGRMVSMTPQERQTVLDTARANGWTELFESVNRDYQEWNGAIVDYMVSTGVINEQMGEIFKKYGDYIPFYREFEGEADERLIAGMQDLIGEELAQMEADGRMPPMTSAQRARMPASMFGSLTGVKPPRKAKGGESMVVDPLTGIMRNLEAAVTSGMKNVAATRVMDDAVLIGMATEVEPNQRRADTHVVRMNGEDRFFNVFDPLLHDSLAGMGEGRIKYLNFFSAPAQFLREMVTRSPDFIMANLLRDSLSTWTTAGGTKPVVDTMRNFFSGETEASRALQSAGIISGFDNARTSKDLAKKFGKKLRDQGQTPGKKIPFWGTATKLWEWSGDVSTKSDAATRQAVYESVLQELLEKGVSRGQAEAEAIYQAAEVINFSRRGNSALAKIITAVIPFMNARIQGLDLLYRAGTGKYSTVTNETRNRALIGFLSRASLLATTSLMYAGMVEDEDEYKAARPEERDDNWIIPGFGDMPGFKIPVPFEVGFLFKTVPERVYHYYSGDQTYKQSVDAIKRGVVSTLEFNVFGPQITKPAMEAMMNHSFYTGSTIVPWYLTDADPEYQKRLSTNELAVTIGDAFNTSPLKVEHVLRGYTGTLGGYILTVADWGMRNLKGLPARPTLRADQMMIARRFLQDSEGAEGLMSEWYTFRNSTRGIMKAFNTAKKDGDIEAAREIFEKNSGVVSVNSAVNQIDNQLTRLRRAERFILMDPKTTPDQKAEAVKRIDAARNAILSSSKKIMETADLSPKFPFPLSILDD